MLIDSSLGIFTVILLTFLLFGLASNYVFVPFNLCANILQKLLFETFFKYILLEVVSCVPVLNTWFLINQKLNKFGFPFFFTFH